MRNLLILAVSLLLILLSGPALAWQSAVCTPGGAQSAGDVDAVGAQQRAYWCFQGGSGTSPNLVWGSGARGLDFGVACVGGACSYKIQRSVDGSTDWIDVAFIDGDGVKATSVDGTPEAPGVPILPAPWFYRVVAQSGDAIVAVAGLPGP